MSKDFENLSYEQIQKIANEEIDKKHKLILSSSGNWIVEDEDDYITYGDISHSVNRLSSIKDLERFFDDTNFDESESNYYGLDEETKADLIEQAKQYDSEFYLAIRDNYDNPYEFKICKNIDEGLAFVSKERFVKLIDDKDEIIEKYASEYLKAGYMNNNSPYYHLGAKRNERLVLKNYFDLDDLVKEYEISPLEELSKNLDSFIETPKKAVLEKSNLDVLKA